ncbi:MAG: hypothetical protein CMQ40_11035 [Gammaproteobacteria bacterium]|nr:hypothetical protein [Gammaproteobacteria bacterium]
MMDGINFSQAINNFHFIRAEWLLLAIPAILLFLVLKLKSNKTSNWEEVIDPGLLQFLIEGSRRKINRTPIYLLLLAWLVAILALAGPAWRKIPQPVQEKDDALVIILDLTKSMLANDVKPDRLTKAKRKIIDLLRARKEGETGLIVYAGSAFVVSPLTDDSKTIESMIPSLSPDLIPSRGSRLEKAIHKSAELLRDAGKLSGQILLITDEIRDIAAAQKAAKNSSASYPISVLSVGTNDGAPVPRLSGNSGSGFVRDKSGSLIIARVKGRDLANFADFSGGKYSEMTATDRDLRLVLDNKQLAGEETYKEVEREFDVWHEEGPLLVIFLLPIAAFAFRRGLILSIALFFTFPSHHTQASSWDDLWRTRDQQGMRALDQEDPAKAALLFEDENWKAIAHYRDDNYEEAINYFKRAETAGAKYNLGNALAKSGNLEEAINAYEESLVLDPDNEDTIFNKDLVEKLLEKEKQSNQKRNNDQEGEKSQDKTKSEGKQDSQDKPRRDKKNNRSNEKKNQEQLEKNKTENGNSLQHPKNSEKEKDNETEGEESKLKQEEQQALEQWLRRVPDDPGGLLRNKFRIQYEEQIKKGEESARNVEKDW